MRIVCVSDIHNKTRGMAPLPEGDVLIVAGDMTGSGSLPAITDFSYWLSEQYFSHKLIIAGNHDWCFWNHKERSIEILSKAGGEYMEDSAITINGIKFYGSPWQPEFCNWAFNLPRGKQLADKWKLIPDSTNVLITHGPPEGILDTVVNGGHAGCKDLAERVSFLWNLKLHVFGHIHHSHGAMHQDGVQFVNASICTEGYEPTNAAIVVDI